MAQPLDAKKLELGGEPFPIAEQIFSFAAVSAAYFSASANGSLAYRSGASAGRSEMVWLDRSGKRLGTVGELGDYSNPALSPDEKRLAVSRVDLQTKTRDIWLYDLTRGTSSRLTFDPAEDMNPTWSPDGSRIAFTSERKGQRDIYQKLASGTGEDELLFQSAERKSVEDWSPDGRFLIYNFGPTLGTAVRALPLGGDRKPLDVLRRSEGGVDMSQVSPNGQWIAYRSTESGKPEVYVQFFSVGEQSAKGKWQISTNGGMEPRWRRDGKELFYITIDNKLMAVEVQADASAFHAGIPKPLFELRFNSQTRRNRYVVAAKGQRFLALLAPEQTAATPITVVVNWMAGLKR
jgi:Tol biopolymer transport system component